MLPMSALFATDLNVITHDSLAIAGTVNCWMLAMFSPPDAAKISKLGARDRHLEHK